MSTHSINATFGIANSSPAPSLHIGTSQVLWAAASIAAAAVLAAAGLLAIHFFPLIWNAEAASALNVCPGPVCIL